MSTTPATGTSGRSLAAPAGRLSSEAGRRLSEAGRLPEEAARLPGEPDERVRLDERSGCDESRWLMRVLLKMGIGTCGPA
jgi:hypothetical protein